MVRVEVAGGRWQVVGGRWQVVGGSQYMTASRWQVECGSTVLGPISHQLVVRA